MGKIGVVVADDHKILREGVVSLLKDEDDIQIIGEAENGEELLSRLSNTVVDVVLLDIGLPGMNGLDAAIYIIKHFPNTKILVFSSYDEDQYILKMLEIGVSGYMLKTSGSKELVAAIKAVAVGDSYFCKEVIEKLRNQVSGKKESKPHPDIPLTKRELEILKLVGTGMTNVEIGRQLFISPRTVDTHRRNLMKKLDLHNAVALTRFAQKYNLLD